MQSGSYIFSLEVDYFDGSYQYQTDAYGLEESYEYQVVVRVSIFLEVILNYLSTFIVVAEDCKATSGKIPASRGGRSNPVQDDCRSALPLYPRGYFV